jgi:hypothetical protein
MIGPAVWSGLNFSEPAACEQAPTVERARVSQLPNVNSGSIPAD